MIKNIAFSNKDNVTCPVNLGVNVSPYPETKDGLIINNSINVNIQWEHKGRSIKIEGHYSFAYPAVGMEFVIVIYDENKSTESAIIYDANGNLYLTLGVPKLISEFALKNLKSNKIEPYRIGFNQVLWKFDENNHKKTCLRICYMYNRYYEDRVINPETGEFGECLGSGRL